MNKDNIITVSVEDMARITSYLVMKVANEAAAEDEDGAKFIFALLLTMFSADLTKILLDEKQREEILAQSRENSELLGEDGRRRAWDAAKELHKMMEAAE